MTVSAEDSAHAEGDDRRRAETGESGLADEALEWLLAYLRIVGASLTATSGPAPPPAAPDARTGHRGLLLIQWHRLQVDPNEFTALFNTISSALTELLSRP